MLKIFWEHDETKSFYIKKNQTSINGSGEKISEETHIHPNVDFVHHQLTFLSFKIVFTIDTNHRLLL